MKKKHFSDLVFDIVFGILLRISDNKIRDQLLKFYSFNHKKQL